jgi:hypothetical protein
VLHDVAALYYQLRRLRLGDPLQMLDRVAGDRGNVRKPKAVGTSMVGGPVYRVI